MPLNMVGESTKPSSIQAFRNEPFTNFSVPGNRRAMEAAIEMVRSQLGREYDLLIGSERIRTKEKLISYNPSRKKEVIGVFQKATPDLAERAVETACGHFQRWANVSDAERADHLFRAGAILRERRLEMAAWMVFEVG